MRTAIAGVVSLVAFGSINGLIAQKERLLASGEKIYLRLAPVDPRSLMQGDYMSLGYALANSVPETAPADGRIVVSLDDLRIGVFVRIDDGTPLAANERVVRYRKRGWSVRIGAESFFFQEGKAKEYEKAAYGELRVAASGECLLAGLADEKCRRLGE